MLEDLTFLEEGEYTARTEIVREIAEDLKKSTRTSWGAVCGYVSDMSEYKNWFHKSIPILSQWLRKKHKAKVFRKRTASEILESGYVTGCTDTALAFIVLARELGVPTRYVETFDEDWLKDRNANGIGGHIFVDVFVNGNWRVYEPKTGFTRNNDYSMNGIEYVEVGKGLDFSEVYFKENGVYRSISTNLQSLDEAIRIFKS